MTLPIDKLSFPIGALGGTLAPADDARYGNVRGFGLRVLVLALCLNWQERPVRIEL